MWRNYGINRDLHCNSSRGNVKTETDKDSYAFTTQKESREMKIVNLTMQWDSNPLTINDTAAQNQTLFTTA